jgi:DNA-binding transcriptional regulator GbsR (MarR family)
MHRDPKARVILGLSREAQLHGQREEDGSVLVPLSAAELAEQVGLSERETSEVLRRLERLRIVQPNARGLSVTDVERLEEFFEFLEMREKFGDG